MQIQSDPPIQTYTSQEDFVVARTGRLLGKAAALVYILGRRTVFNATTPFQDLATYLVGGQNALNTVSVTTPYFIVSTSATDVAGSAGISAVRIIYLDEFGGQKSKTVFLNGTTKVDIGSGYSAFQWIESAALGTAAASAAVGDIAIFSGAGAAAAEATTVEQILATGNRSLTGRYTIPAGYTGYLKRWVTTAAGSQAMDIRLRAEVFADDRTLSAGIFHFQASSYLGAGTNASDELLSLALPELCMVKTSVYPAATTGTPRCDVNVRLLIVAK